MIANSEESCFIGGPFVNIDVNDIYFVVRHFPLWTNIGYADARECVTVYNNVFYYIAYQVRRYVWVTRYTPDDLVAARWSAMRQQHSFTMETMPTSWWNQIHARCHATRIAYVQAYEVAGAVKPEFIRWRKQLPLLLMENALS